MLCVLFLAAAAEALQSSFPSPLAGVSVSPLGFAVLLASTERKPQRLCPVSISRRDTERVVSAEGHTILQLLQGIDAATQVLPPDALEREFQSEDVFLEKVCIRRRRTLGGEENVIRDARKLVRTDDDRRCDLAAAASRAPALRKALKGLGLSPSEAEAVALLRKYSNQGELTRQAFAEVVNDLRDETCATDHQIETRLVAVDGRDVEASTNFAAFALALRHSAPVSVDDALFDVPDLAFDAADAATRFPLLQNMNDLKAQGLRLEAHSRQLFSQASLRVASALAPRSGHDHDIASSSSPSRSRDEDETGSPPFQPREHF